MFIKYIYIIGGENMKKHDYDAAWKTILEAFEEEIVELLFPEIYDKINWEIKSEALDNELLEIQKDIFSKEEAEKIVSDKIIKVTMKDNESKILFIHVEVQSYSSNENVFAERKMYLQKECLDTFIEYGISLDTNTKINQI